MQVVNNVTLMKPQNAYTMILIFRTILIVNIQNLLKPEQITWNWLDFREKYMELITSSVFLLPQSIFCIYNVSFWIPLLIWIIFEIHTELLDT